MSAEHDSSGRKLLLTIKEWKTEQWFHFFSFFPQNKMRFCQFAFYLLLSLLSAKLRCIHSTSLSNINFILLAWLLTQNLFTKRLEPGPSHLRRKQDTRSVTKIWGWHICGEWLCYFMSNNWENKLKKYVQCHKKKSIMLILVPQLTNCQTDKIIHTVVFILNDYINACLLGWH